MKSTITTKYSILLLLIFGSAIFSSCGDKKLLVKFDMDYSDIELIAIPDTSTTGTVSVTLPVNSTLEQSLQQNGASKDQIKSIRIKVSRFEITEPSTGNFDFLGAIVEFIGKDSLNLAKVAEKEIVPFGVKTLDLDVSPDNDIVEALKAEKFYIDFRTTKRGAITDTLKMKAFMKFEVIAEVN